MPDRHAYGRGFSLPGPTTQLPLAASRGRRHAAFSHETWAVSGGACFRQSLAWISGQFIPTGVYAYKGEFYNVRWGGFQQGRVLTDSARREGVLPFYGLTAMGRSPCRGLA